MAQTCLGLALSLSLWLKHDYIPDNTDLFFGSWDPESQIRIVMADTPHLNTQFLVARDGGVQSTFVAKSAMTPNIWQHLVVVWDSDKEVGSVYVDGVSWTVPWTGHGWTPMAQDFTIGRSGIVDEVRLYDRPFDANDVARVP